MAFKKLQPPQVTPLPLEEVQDLELVCEMDEQWSFVGKRSEQAGCGMPGDPTSSGCLLTPWGDGSMSA